MADVTDILRDDEEKLSDEELLRYLHEELSEEEKHEIEKKMSADPFKSDAAEGLSSINKKENLHEYVHQLNKNLHQQLAGKKQRNGKRKIKELPLLILAILLILFICVACYFVIHLHNKRQQNKIKSPTTFVSPIKVK
ncbi:MAG: hypothetical protein JWQ96_1216 [Segetibacter sp.]|nr:hypothetical protein [Segetibacter sp.]